MRDAEAATDCEEEGGFEEPLTLSSADEDSEDAQKRQSRPKKPPTIYYTTRTHTQVKQVQLSSTQNKCCTLCSVIYPQKRYLIVPQRLCAPNTCTHIDTELFLIFA
jgi:hypothetical protein